MSNVPPYQPIPPAGNAADQRPLYVLIAGILTFVVCPLAGIYSLVVGNTLKKEYGGTIPSPGNIGYILGIIGLALSVLGILLWIVLIVALAASS
jgi:hypothetical protein